jgi:hypothetical protein
MMGTKSKVAAVEKDEILEGEGKRDSEITWDYLYRLDREVCAGLFRSWMGGWAPVFQAELFKTYCEPTTGLWSLRHYRFYVSSLVISVDARYLLFGGKYKLPVG